MNRAFNKYGKARWEETRLSKPFKARRAYRWARFSALYAAQMASITLMSRAPAVTPRELSMRRAQIATAVINAHSALIQFEDDTM